MHDPVHHKLPAGFEVIERLGRGGEGTIYRVSHAGTAQQHVVKVFHEPLPQHLMLSREGSFFYVDFGYGVSTLDHSETRRLNLFGYGFAAFLAALHGRNLRLVQEPIAGHDYDEPCIYFSPSLLDALVPSNSWVTPIITMIRSAPAEILLEADFYRALSSELPHRLQSPGLIIAAGHLLRILGTLWHTVGAGAGR